MDPLIVVNHRFDIPLARRLREQVVDARVVVTCPHLADRCQADGLTVGLP